MTEEDHRFYDDNCRCAYKATCSDTICKAWKKKIERDSKRKAYYEWMTQSDLCTPDVENVTDNDNDDVSSDDSDQVSRY